MVDEGVRCMSMEHEMRAYDERLWGVHKQGQRGVGRCWAEMISLSCCIWKQMASASSVAQMVAALGWS